MTGQDGWMGTPNGHESEKTLGGGEGQGSLYHSVANAIYVQFRGGLKP